MIPNTDIALNSENISNNILNQSVGAAHLNRMIECPRYDTKQNDGEASVMSYGEYPFIAITTRSTLARSGST